MNRSLTTPCYYLTPKQDDFNKIPELQVCIAEALYDVDSIVADPGAYTKDELATLYSQILSNLEWAWELTDGSEDQLLSTMMQISQMVARQFNKQEWGHAHEPKPTSNRRLGYDRDCSSVAGLDCLRGSALRFRNRKVAIPGSLIG